MGTVVPRGSIEIITGRSPCESFVGGSQPLRFDGAARCSSFGGISECSPPSSFVDRFSYLSVCDVGSVVRFSAAGTLAQ